MAKRESKPPANSIIGRPTKYDHSFCEMLIEHMKQGYSFGSFGALVDSCEDTVYEWAKVHPAFSEAKKIGLAKSMIWWEKQGMQGLWEEHGKDALTMKLNTTAWIFNMKNKHGWRDKHDVDVKHEDTQLAEREKLRKMSMRELTDLIKENLKDTE